MVLLLGVACLASCDKEDNASGDSGRTEKIDVSKVAFDGNFRHIKVDSAYVFHFSSQLEDMLSEDGIDFPDVDFSQNAVIAVTGIAPTSVSDISVSLCKSAGRYILDMDVHSSRPESVSLQQWSLLLEVPQSVDPKVECNINYDSEFDSGEAFDSLCFKERGAIKLVLLEDSHLLEIKAADSTRFLSVLESGGCNILQKCVYGQTDHIQYNNGTVKHGEARNEFFEYLDIYDQDLELMHIIVENCDYQTLLAPLEEDILYYAPIYDYGKTTNDISYNGPAFVFVRCHFVCGDVETFLRSAMESLGVEFMWIQQDSSFPALFKTLVRLHRSSKVNMYQLHKFLILSGLSSNILGSSIVINQYVLN